MHVRLFVAADHIAIQVPARNWEDVQENVMVLTPSERGDPVISRLGSLGADLPLAAGAHSFAVLSIADFDPMAAASAVRYWAMEGITKATGRPRVLVWLDRYAVDLAWAEWEELSAEKRKEFLALVAPFADVSVNGELRTKWPLRHRILRQKPTVMP